MGKAQLFLLPTKGATGLDAIDWLLRDEFTTDRAAGSVDGTPTDPDNFGVLREVIDTDGDGAVIAGGKLVLQNPNSVWGDPGYWPDKAIARTAGQLLVISYTTSLASLNDSCGFSLAKSGQPAAAAIGFFTASGNIYIRDGGTGPIIAKYASTTQYFIAIILRATGLYLFIKGGVYTDWTLLYVSNTSSDATLYVAIVSQSGAPSSDFCRLPANLIHPTPIAYDSFTRGDGALGSTETTGPDGQAATARSWVTTTGVIDTNQMKVVPTLGAELLTNGDFSSWTGDDPDGWTVIGEVGADPEISEVGSGESHGGVGTGSANFYSTATAQQPRITQSGIISSNSWLSCTMIISERSSGAIGCVTGILTPLYNSTGTKTSTGISNSTDFIVQSRASSLDVTIDSVSLKQISLASCIAAVTDSTTRNVYAQVEITCTDDTQAGLMIGLDSQPTPLNYLHIYLNRVDNKIYVDSVTAGVVTNISSVAFTYAAGATLAVRHDGTNLYVWYNNAYVTNSATAMPGTGTLVGVFATDDGTRFDNFLVYPTTGYTELDPYIA